MNINTSDKVTEKEIFQRTELLLGEEKMSRLAGKRVLIVGVGGVGSWCAEALVRTGIRQLTIIDSDSVNLSNLNRQLIATVSSIGRPKVEVLRERLLQINPYANINALQASFCALGERGYELKIISSADNETGARTAYDYSTTAAQASTTPSSSAFDLSRFDYIIDAIDTLKDKAALILNAADSGAVFFSSMGSALKVDPTRIKVADFWKVRDCPLGAALRKRLRQRKTLPAKSFLCVYSDEVLGNLGESSANSAALLSEATSAGKAVVNGTTAPITAIFGMTLAGLVIRDIYSR